MANNRIVIFGYVLKLNFTHAWRAFSRASEKHRNPIGKRKSGRERGKWGEKVQTCGVGGGGAKYIHATGYFMRPTQVYYSNI